MRGRARAEGVRAATTAARRGRRMSPRSSIGSVPELRETLRVERPELPLDVVHDDSHDEDPDDEIEEDAHLDERRHRLVKELREDEDPVLENEVSRDLRDRLAPRRQEEEAREERRERHRNDEEIAVRRHERK